MSGMLRPLSLAVVLLAAAVVPGRAQAVAPSPPYHAMDPRSPLTPYAQSPVQQQVIENYRAQLQAVQREQLQQNPSGISRNQLDTSRQLNAFGPGFGTAPPPLNTTPPPYAAPTRP